MYLDNGSKSSKSAIENVAKWDGIRPDKKKPVPYPPSSQEEKENSKMWRHGVKKWTEFPGNSWAFPHMWLPIVKVAFCLFWFCFKYIFCVTVDALPPPNSSSKLIVGFNIGSKCGGGGFEERATKEADHHCRHSPVDLPKSLIYAQKLLPSKN
jgi:hypothetical protein